MICPWCEFAEMYWDGWDYVCPACGCIVEIPSDGWDIG